MAYLYSNNICIYREFIIVPVGDARNRVLSRGGGSGGGLGYVYVDTDAMQHNNVGFHL